MPGNIWLLFFLFISVFHLTKQAFAVNQQGEALLSWKRSLNGPLQALSNWDSTDGTPCGWFGITCNFNKEVTEVSLQNMDLFGNVPNNFSSLLSLNKLVLFGTNLSGSIPKEIGSLQELRLLVLSENALTGGLPGEIFHLPNLEELHLNSNRLEGSIPDEIGNLTSLTSLTLFDNQLSGTIPRSIGNLKKLEVIRAGGNKNLQGSIPEEIGNCTNLVMLGLAETSISGFLPSSLGLMKNLQTIAIYTSLLSGQIPPELGDCTALQSIYLYENSLTGSIPTRLGNLPNLQNLLLWQNNLVGTIPPELGNCKQLVVIDASLNSLTGSIPMTFGNLSLLQELQLSVNQISGQIPSELGNCTALTLIELDNNQITGIFELQNLNKLLLLSNNLSSSIPPEIGKCWSLIRFRASDNQLTGSIPPDIGKLKNLNFLDLGSNRLTGLIPPEISGCQNLTFLDLHSNSIGGNLPENLTRLVSLQFVDFSNNLLEGSLSPSLGSLNSLTKLVLGKNKFSGKIPSQLGSCLKLQLLDLSSNGFSGEIPASLGKIPALEIALNLSWNSLSGNIPSEFAALDKLGVLDISHNQLTGDLHFLADLQNLVVLNISYNNFSGRVPDTPFFSKLPLSVLAGNQELCFSGNQCSADKGGAARRSKGARVAMVVLLCTACVLLLAALFIILGNKKRGLLGHECHVDSDGDDVEMGPPWEVTVYQKLDLSIKDVLKSLVPSNIIGRGHSGIVYQVILPSGLSMAVKRFRASDKLSASAFSSEIATLARIRHRNIVRLLGWAANRKTKLLFYDYLPNGTLGTLLHDGRASGAGGLLIEWETRFKIGLGVAEGLAYLHHDCRPPILHRDVKAHNILLGDRYEPCLADFGLARLVEDENRSFSTHPQFAGSYGYFAPEYGCMLKITEKSDVFSYGVVLLEIITGKKPVDPSFPAEHQHLIQWVRDHLKSKKDPVDIIDQKLQGHPDTQIQEMLQALGIALLCTSNRAEDRPTMKDVVALLKEIRQDHDPSAAAAAGEVQKPANKSGRSPGEVSLCNSSTTSSSVTPAQLLQLQGSSNCSFGYSSSSTSYNSRNQ
nr:LRR receptor-like serine/threonine-protein kinase isoform X2 [Coffea arabica]